VEVARPDWPKITLLSPTTRRLGALRRSWTEALNRVQRGEPDEAPFAAVPTSPLDDLEKLAATETTADRSIPNGSSIAFLLEHGGASCLLAADAFVPVLGAALTSLVNHRGGQPVDLDVFKLSHHGSERNTTQKLLALAPARHYVVSTNGDAFSHPDDVALARVLTFGTIPPTLWFNYGTDANRRWGDPALCARYGHRARFPASHEAGVRLELPRRGAGGAP
jgi:hypothetical protein